MENWLPVTGYEGFYEVSDHGQVRSVTRTNEYMPGRFRTEHGRLRKQSPHSNASGHPSVTLSRGGKRKTHLVHHLVLEAFVGPRPEGLQGLHWDDVSTNNHLSNLRWGTRSDNGNDRVRNGKDPNANKTQCVHGHEYTDENTYWHSTGRHCRTCNRLAAARVYSERKLPDL